MTPFSRALRSLRPLLQSKALPLPLFASNALRASLGCGQRYASASASHAVASRSNATATAKDAPSVEIPLSEDEKATAAAKGQLFTSLKDVVSPGVLKAITQTPFKFEHMTSVQEAVLPLLPGIAEPYIKDQERTTVRDLLVRAKTGTGKTLAFLVPVIEAREKAIKAFAKQATVDAAAKSDKSVETQLKQNYAHDRVGTLIISPTRELATQIANEAIKLASHVRGFEVRLFTGGMSKGVQLREWRRGRKDIVVTTPGRMRDLMENEPGFKDALGYTQTLILDEADTLLDMGFRDDIEYISSQLPQKPERQTFLFSATIDKRVEQIAYTMLNKNHKYINTVSEETSPVHAHVPQYHTVLPNANEQLPHILRLIAHDQLTNPAQSKIILFCNTTRMTMLIASILRELAPAVLPSRKLTKIYEIHSKKEQNSRTNTSDRFRQDKTGAAILVTSDVSARGVDYPGVSRIIQVGIPGSFEQYIHRVGRTGRTGGFVGRGDLVLLPWEVGFPTYNLAEVPLKPVTSQELHKQLMALAKEFDEKPPGPNFTTPIPFVRKEREHAPVQIRPPVTPSLEAMGDEISRLLSSLDEEAVRETFTSMLGFYTTRERELRCTRNAILEGCKQWTVEACGLERPPYVSEAFIARLGISREDRRKPARNNFGLNRRKPDFWDNNKRPPRFFGGDRDYEDRRDHHGSGGQQLFGAGGRLPDDRSSGFRGPRFSGSKPSSSFGLKRK